MFVLGLYKLGLRLLRIRCFPRFPDPGNVPWEPSLLSLSLSRTASTEVCGGALLWVESPRKEGAVSILRMCD